MWIKLETLQPTFSYKIRGAFNAVARMVEEHGLPRPALVTASAGNHGRALAYAALRSGIPLTVYVPEHAPRTKLEAIRALGADLRSCRDYDEAERAAKAHAARGHGLFISPYSHPDVIAGAGTVGLEMLEDCPYLDLILVPVGGGGLISGIAIASSQIASRVAVSGVEVEASSPFTRSLAAGRVVEIDVQPTLADGLAGNLDPDTVTFGIVQRLVRTIVRVSEEDLRAAVSGIVTHEKLIAEGAGAAAVAALLGDRIDVRGQRAAAVLSGGNIDNTQLREIL